VQDGVPTVQGELERALAEICGGPVRITGAGRTDAGVHATGQVISFRTASALDGGALGRGVNALLPEDIAVSAVEAVGDEFHARFSATGRRYEYRIRCAAQREPLERHREHWLPGPLDVDAMSQAARALIGRRDFTAFATGATGSTGAAGRGGSREVREARWSRDGDVLTFAIAADAFLRGMVRAIVGTMIWVGRGKVPAAGMERIVASRDRANAGPSAPARGLCLVQVEYGERRKRRSGDDDDDNEDE
jgi:tRNA pseudouridine38-40 synthase